MSIWESYDQDYGEDEELIELDPCRLVRETEKAWLILHKGREAWFPKSQCVWSPGAPTLFSDKGTLEYPQWLKPEWRKVSLFK